MFVLAGHVPTRGCSRQALHLPVISPISTSPSKFVYVSVLRAIIQLVYAHIYIYNHIYTSFRKMDFCYLMFHHFPWLVGVALAFGELTH